MIDIHTLQGVAMAIAIPVGAAGITWVGSQSVEFVDTAKQAHSVTEQNNMTLENITATLETISEQNTTIRESIAKQDGVLQGITLAISINGRAAATAADVAQQNATRLRAVTNDGDEDEDIPSLPPPRIPRYEPN